MRHLTEDPEGGFDANRMLCDRDREWSLRVVHRPHGCEGFEFLGALARRAVALSCANAKK